MDIKDRAVFEELVTALGAAASYNDKGYAWSGHEAARQQEFRRGIQETLSGLARQIGADTLGRELFEALQSGAASRDDSGRFQEFARNRLAEISSVPPGS